MTLPLLPGETAMPSLERVQRRICAAIVGGADLELLSIIDPDGIASAARLQIYRNHAFLTLSEALKAIYPVVCRLVDERFFAYAAHEFIRGSLPTRPCLVEYGDGFADFLAHFPPCRHLAYLPDVAKLEWAMNEALHAHGETPIDGDALARVPSAEGPRLVFRVHPSLRLIESPWPIERIWRANQPGAAADETIELDAGSARLQVHRGGDRVLLSALDPGAFAFVKALAAGAPLLAAAEAALALDPLFDLALRLRILLDEGLLVDCRLAPAAPSA